ncbi:cupin domain-containing protein [Roseomonas sp. NAR14]|uniref:Cupin domain-containing protein n=1 Tax=Roseomonas acroporae TaxID=2937791 RepID=A0A9X1Y4B2_9PROT|nr:cupin domain-containing protein [Roseomonas acroporae]MCK8783168.1 cupin domain-containing protein [Roseomonas acroporae]
MSLTLDALLAPVTAERFLAEHYDRQPLHVRGTPEKFAQVLSWRGINRLLDMTHAWSGHSLKLVMDGTPVPPEQYCARAAGRDTGAQGMQPEARLVQEWIGRGASLVLNDVDSLTPGLAAVSDALEAAGLGKAAANVYISWKEHKAFPAHFDTHDVWAVQVEGEKTWNIWEGRAEWPIPHPVFRSLGQAHHEQAKGKLREVVRMRPGDLLYLPRGWYHDALAEGAASVHVAYGVNAPLGMDVLNILVERALYDTLFRQPLPRQDGSAAARFALTSRAGQIGQRLAELARDPKVMEVLERFVGDYRFRRGGYDLLAARGLGAAAAMPGPGGAEGDAPVFRVIAGGARPVRRGAEFVLKTQSGALPLSPAEAEAAGWLLSRPDVAEPELRAAHPAVDAPGLLGRLRAAGLLVAA